ncbi:MAG: NAD(P)/FAD-dependent oxidoreductase [Saprospiraceae bacterium]|nr:NAD(P)/FAD-dependent oxidoreductase [Saprospiraceae bacterium]MCC6844627.1 NAD(P)/FAD-dependent oxidoreductase [Saprospiraceae bacterium]HRG32541.1 NAD(P)/FAD-dependent oxidoreductase [Saprospiraceae bacterium]
MISKIAIIGNGISGVTAARFIRKNSIHEVVLISEESEYFFSRTALMYVYMGHMQWKDIQPYERGFWKKNKIDLIQARAESIQFDKKCIQLNNGSTVNYDYLILATGSKSNKYGWPGQDLSGVRGLYHKQDLEYLERCSPGIRRAVIVGGGLIGIELAEMFQSRNIPVSFLVREPQFWSMILPEEESMMISRHILEHGIDLRLNSQLKEINGDEAGNVHSVTLDSGEEIKCDYVGLTAGVSPNIKFIESSELETDRGILVDEYLRTNIPDVYAIGDCAQLRKPRKGRRDIEAVWYTGRMMGECVAQTICGKQKIYDPGIWFNSAKFFDIEYQVYGQVPSKMTDDLESFYWAHENGKKSIRIVYEKMQQTVVGFNLMGIRFRHEVCEQWILRKSTLDKVLEEIRLAFFDPEFYEDCSAELLEIYRQKSGKKIEATAGWRLDEVNLFLNKNNQKT